MKRIVIVLCWLMPLFVQAQNIEGVKFNLIKNWQGVLDQAKLTNKPIFVDLYTTWCGFCKQMDREVFANKQLGDYINANFVAIKVQMDSSAMDNEYVKGWYKDAVRFENYVTGYPAFLFFNADGKYAGKESGFHNVNDFLGLLKKNADPKGSYLVELEAFKEGRLNKEGLLRLAYWAKEIKDDSVAFTIAQAYKKEYVDPVPVSELLNPEADRFNATFLNLYSTNDKIIRYMYEHPEETVEKFKRWPKYSRNITDFIIIREYIDPFVKSGNRPISEIPDWKKIERAVTMNFDKETAKRLLLDAKISRAYELKDWNNVARLEFEKIDRYGMDTTDLGKLGVNNLMYEVVFKQIDDARLLKKALSIMKDVVILDSSKVHPRLDTYASILYKSGQRDRAIEVEKQALNLAAMEKDNNNIKFYTEIIEKMNKDLPFWK